MSESELFASRTFDPAWETEIYGQEKHLNRYPFDTVVSFVYRNYPRHKPRNETRILEVGCGAANNLWFAAREGFQVAGIDGSESAIAYARQRFADERLSGDLRVGDFAKLPFSDDFFDLAVDRGALTCCGFSVARVAIGEVRRVLHPGGRFMFSPYSDRHSGATSGTLGPDGLVLDIADTGLRGLGQLCFYGRENVNAAFPNGWKMLSVQHIEVLEEKEYNPSTQAHWLVVAERLG